MYVSIDQKMLVRRYDRRKVHSKLYHCGYPREIFQNGSDYTISLNWSSAIFVIRRGDGERKRVRIPTI